MRSRALLFACLGLWACPGDPEPTPFDAGPDLANPIDPLSMPAEPLWSSARFRSAETCRACHPDHYAEWRTSMHAYAMIDPVFRGLVQVRQRDFGGERDAFCTQCHSAIGTRSATGQRIARHGKERGRQKEKAVPSTLQRTAEAA